MLRGRSEAFAFAHDKCTEVKVWVGQSKLKKKLAAAEKAGRLPSARGLPENAAGDPTSEADASKVQPAADPGDAATAPASAPHAPTTDAVPPAAAPPEAVPRKPRPAAAPRQPHLRATTESLRPHRRPAAPEAPCCAVRLDAAYSR